MFDFLKISTRNPKRDTIEIYPKFLLGESNDLMIRGGDFYAIWNEKTQKWSTNENDAIRLIDEEIKNFADEYCKQYEGKVHVLYMWDSDSGVIDKWHKYCQKQLRDSFHVLDETLVFSNSETNKNDYSSKSLNYPLEPGDISAYDKIISTLYSDEERHKIEWAIGSIVSGESKYIQKFMVLYGAAGTGKSTILNIIQMLFDGYYSVFDAKALGSSTNSFALESFKTNPLVAIQHDGDLSRIEDNTRLNSLVSHELMTVNEKFKSTYPNRFRCFLFMGTNKPVKITDAKSGLIRRLIDVCPTGNKLGIREYNTLTKQIKFELGAIAYHCKEVYLSDPGRYDDYIPTAMLGASNDFYNFVIDSYHIFKRDDSTTLKAAWEMYKTYCDDAKVPFPLSQRSFKEELKNYFWEYDDRLLSEDGLKLRSYYSGFRTDKFEDEVNQHKKYTPELIDFNSEISIFDREYADSLAQYASIKETPLEKWSNVSTKLSDIDTSKLHYVMVPKNHIVIDFDIRDENGKKSFEKNLEEASKWPPTYAELSKSGGGIHLHYIYNGDVSKLSSMFSKDIEVKVFNGNSSLRRKLTKCNGLPIVTISSGLPLKESDKVMNYEGFKNEKSLRAMIEKNLRKEIHSNTKCSVDFIYKNLEDAYNCGLKYDVSDMKNDILAFAANSTNQANTCIKTVCKMKFKSDEPSENIDDNEAPIVFYDVEVFPNLFLINWKYMEDDVKSYKDIVNRYYNVDKSKPLKNVVRMINPKPKDVEDLIKFRLIGYNCRRYDNHILYAALMGYSNQELFELSQRIINAKKGESNKYFFGEAYNISYTDIYDFASAQNKKSLKKLEIEMGMHHQELGLPWDKPVPKEKWIKVAEYCDNDVISTEAAFHYLNSDWTARQILADLTNSSVNDTTNNLTTKFIFGSNRKPQDQFRYRNLAEPVNELPDDVFNFLLEAAPEMMKDKHVRDGKTSLLPFFPGYKFENGISTYRGEEVSEGGYVYAKEGIHVNVALLDIASMHPHTIISECLFGVKFTTAFKEIVDGRVSIKHKAWDVVNNMLDGKLSPYIQKVIDGEMTSKQLANALKTAINAVYGLTFAGFPNAFKDKNNIDNIVAKRGALFMVDLKHAVQEKGYTVAHIKTDSIKIPNADKEIIQFVMDFGKRYGYTFEHEATYDRMCLVNDAVYIAQYKNPEECKEMYGYIPDNNSELGMQWTATGTQFAVPYVFKTLFSKEPITINDVCEVFSVKNALYLDMNENLVDVTPLEIELEKLEKKVSKLKKQDEPIEQQNVNRIEELKGKIEKGHDYHFIGKVGEFCPIKSGKGGGVLYRKQNDKYYAPSGSTGYRWLESELIRSSDKDVNKIIDDYIDLSFYRNLVDKAKDTISKYGSFESFVSDPDLSKNLSKKYEMPPWKVACGKDTCEGCPNLNDDEFHMDCSLGYDISDFARMNDYNENSQSLAFSPIPYEDDEYPF